MFSFLEDFPSLHWPLRPLSAHSPWPAVSHIHSSSLPSASVLLVFPPLNTGLFCFVLRQKNLHGPFLPTFLETKADPREGV